LGADISRVTDFTGARAGEGFMSLSVSASLQVRGPKTTVGSVPSSVSQESGYNHGFSGAIPDTGSIPITMAAVLM
jgi:hypothetical protein